MIYDYYTGKQLDSPEDLQSRTLDEKCSDCGTNLITKCKICGAPNCCPECCKHTTKEAQEFFDAFLNIANSLIAMHKADEEIKRSIEEAKAHEKKFYDAVSKLQKEA